MASPGPPETTTADIGGKVAFRDAFEQSLNAATVNLAVETGLNEIIGTLRSFGIESPPGDLPSLALGFVRADPHGARQGICGSCQ